MLEDQLPLRQDDASEGWSSCANRPRVQLHGSGILNLVAQIHSIGRTYSEVGVDLFRRKHLFWLLTEPFATRSERVYFTIMRSKSL